VVCSFCEKHLEANQAAFKDSRLKLIIDDARAQLEQTEDGSFDVIIGDLADPVYGGPCYQARLHTHCLHCIAATSQSKLAAAD
jgi:thermospermine synthase